MHMATGRKPASKPKLREEVQLVKQQGDDSNKMAQGGRKRKALADVYDKDQYVLQWQIPDNTKQPHRLNKRAKPYKPSGLVHSHLSREPSPTDNISSPRDFPTIRQSQTPRSVSSASQGTHSRTPSFTQLHSVSGHAHTQFPTTCSTSMPVNNYGGFHEEDESVERAFALQHRTSRTTLNSQVLYYYMNNAT